MFMRLGDSPGLNHVGVYVGEQRLLHHVKGRLSSRDIWGGYYQKKPGRIVRYRGGQGDDACNQGLRKACKAPWSTQF